MKKLNIYIGFILIAIISCTERMDIELDASDTKLVVYGGITTDTMSHLVYLSQTIPFNSTTAPQPVSNATVYIEEGENRYDLTEDTNNPGHYYTASNVYGKSGATYKLRIENVNIGGLTEFEAIAQMPVLNEGYQTNYLDSINVTYNTNWEGWVINGFAREPENLRNYYMFRVKINDTNYSDSLDNLILIDDKFFNGNNTVGAAFYFIADKDTLKPGDRVTLELCAISEDYFYYLSEAQTASQPQFPLFSPPPANPRTNLSGGALGYFSAYAIIRSSYVMKEEDFVGVKVKG
ncbi:MAG: hypothetical protein PWR03_1808 [Tenuifilum sp.]|jgi:hypothetical protein|uniref:DUF4249 domain-containing protein n=1 Tax=Tenuifilum sp. TaxID=2760880 RepID=UPI0024AB9A4C|nr:DUF4249 domain-containing protein [Tenuifilum sp.]MDI3527625.1 hypothetical protein [Tenuifilum sp.]